MTNPAPPGGQQVPAGSPFPTGQQFPAGRQFQSGHFAPVHTGPSPVLPQPTPPGPAAPRAPRTPGALLSLLSAALLLVAGGLAIGGTFGRLEEETEHAGGETLRLTYTSWRLKPSGTANNTIYFHAPHFGIPLVATGALAILAAVMLVFGRGRLAPLARPSAVAAAGLLVGTVWAVGLVVSADLDATTRSDDFELDWTSGLGFWLLVAAGVVAAIGGLMALLGGKGVLAAREEPPTPRYGFPAIQGGPGGFGQQGFYGAQGGGNPGFGGPVGPGGFARSGQSGPSGQGGQSGQSGPAGQGGPGGPDGPGRSHGLDESRTQHVDPLGGQPIGPPTPRPFPPTTPPTTPPAQGPENPA